MSAPAWERIFYAPVSRAASPQRWDAFATRIGSHAGAWEPEKMGRFCYPNRFPRRRVGTRKRWDALPESVPTPARGNQKKMGRFTRIGSHAGAWEPETQRIRGEPACSPSFAHGKETWFLRCPYPFLYTILVVLGRHYYLSSQPITNQR
jgi:hypothetical protein